MPSSSGVDVWAENHGLSGFGRCGGDDGSRWLLNERLANYVSNSVKSDTALPGNTASANVLANKIRAVSIEKPTDVGPTPKMAAIISGKVYRFPPNEINVKSLSLILADPQPHYEIEIYSSDTTKSGPRFVGPIGLDGLYCKGETIDIQAVAIRGVYAVNRTSEEDLTFGIHRLVLGQGSADRWL